MKPVSTGRPIALYVNHMNSIVSSTVVYCKIAYVNFSNYTYNVHHHIDFWSRQAGRLAGWQRTLCFLGSNVECVAVIIASSATGRQACMHIGRRYARYKQQAVLFCSCLSVCLYVCLYVCLSVFFKFSIGAAGS